MGPISKPAAAAAAVARAVQDIPALHISRRHTISLRTVRH